MWQGAPYFITGREANIKVLHKKYKDPMNLTSYRPISLINVDGKILSKMLADRLANIMPTLINDTQSGYIRGRSGVSNIRKVMMALEYAKANPMADIIMVTLDAEKAFDNLDLQWLFMVLGKMGFEGAVLNFIKELYASPRAKIDTGACLSSPFSLYKGTRQGCPRGRAASQANYPLCEHNWHPNLQ